MTDSDAPVLLIDDDPAMVALVQSYLADEPFKLDVATCGQDALARLNEQTYQVILLDLGLPDMSGQSLLEHIHTRRIPGEVIVVTGDCAMSTVVTVMQAGARDFLAKPFARSRLLTTIKHCIEHQLLKTQLYNYKQRFERERFGGFIGSSSSMQQVYQIIESAAQSRATAFITGESGTGKEVCAEAIHNHSERRNKPFIALNCGAIPGELVESEIFGHVKGAFTGAHQERDGAARAAHQGTLFLDEICELELALQSKLLRFLQTGTLQKVGSDKLESVDVRIICATNRDPLKQVEDGQFREDLYYRLHVLPIQLPPLRERGNDVIEIARSLLAQYADEEGKQFRHFCEETEQRFAAYNWPGNVRQLQNVVRNIVVLHEGEVVTTEMLPPPLNTAIQHNGHSTPQMAPVASAATTSAPVITDNAASVHAAERIRPLAQVEREAIEEAIALCDGRIPDAAHYLGISAATIYRKRNSWKHQDTTPVSDLPQPSE